MAWIFNNPIAGMWGPYFLGFYALIFGVLFGFCWWHRGRKDSSTDRPPLPVPARAGTGRARSHRGWLRTATMNTMAPPTDPRRRRPGSSGYWIGAGLILAGVVAGVALLVLGFVRLIGPPDFIAEFPDGQTTEVTLDNLDEGTWRVYVNRPVTVGQVDCQVEGPDPAAHAAPSAMSHTIELGSDYWELARDVRVSEPGDYAITCTGEEGLGYAVGQSDGAASTAGTFGLGIAVGAVAVLAGGILLIVTAVRRSRTPA
jgi:hypothetical protein